MPVVDAEIEAQVKVGKRQTRDTPLAVGSRFAQVGGMGPESFFLTAYGQSGRPDGLSFQTLNRMRHDSTLRTGLVLLKAPILRQAQQAQIACDDPSIRRFLEHALLDSGLFYDTILLSLRALEFGMQAGEKEWQVEELDLTYDADDAETGEHLSGSAWQGPALTIKRIADLNPETIRRFRRRGYDPQSGLPVQDQSGKPPDGSFDGFDWNDGQSGTADVHILPQNAFVYTHDGEFGNLWGIPRIRPAYPYYYWKQAVLKWWMNWTEKKVVPPRVMRYPPGIDAETLADNSDIAMATADAIDNVNAVALPSTHNPDGGGYEWDIDEKPSADRVQIFQGTATYLDESMLNAIFVPPRVFSQGHLGSFSSTTAFQDMFLLTIDALLYDILDNANRYLTIPLRVANFGAGSPAAHVTMPGLTHDERARFDAIVAALLTNPDVQAQVDFEALARIQKIPIKQPEPLGGAGVPEVPPVGSAGAPPAAPGGGAPPPEAPPTPGAAAAGPTPSGPAVGGGTAPPANVAAAESILLASGFDATRWDVQPDSKAQSGFAVYDKHFANKRLSGFAARSVIKSYQQQAAAAAKKAAAAQASAARKGAAEQRRQSQAAAADARRQEREAIKTQKAMEREQTKAAHEEARQTAAQQREAAKLAREQAAKGRQETATVLQAARTERSQLEITTSRQASSQVGQTLAKRGWQLASGGLPTHEAALQAASAAADAEPHMVFTVVRTKDGFVVGKKARAQIAVVASKPNVAAADVAPLDALWQEAAERLAPLWQSDVDDSAFEDETE